ncbi:uncharacterized protein LOC144122989 isoform X2 [Amblyomma americanum]
MGAFPGAPRRKSGSEGDPCGTIHGVVGCVDGTLIAIKAPRGDPTNRAAFWSRKGYYAMNTMIICDANMKILAVDPR